MAEQNAYIIHRFLGANWLPEAEWYDVVVFRYLLAVKNWLSRPELHKYKLSTIAWQGMRSAVNHERNKQARRIQMVSLDEEMPGSDGLTWADTVTADNLRYTLYTTMQVPPKKERRQCYAENQPVRN